MRDYERALFLTCAAGHILDASVSLFPVEKTPKAFVNSAQGNALGAELKSNHRILKEFPNVGLVSVVKV